MDTTRNVELPDDPEGAVAVLREELRDAKRRRDLRRRANGFAFVRSAVLGPTEAAPR